VDDEQFEEYIKDYLAVKEASLYAFLLDSNEFSVEEKAEIKRRITLSLDL
jgi:hypothetical protein